MMSQKRKIAIHHAIIPQTRTMGLDFYAGKWDYHFEMTLPAGLIFVRILSIPLFLVLFFHGCADAATAVFAAAALTDLFDGIVARRRGQFTDFIKIADPLADKMLICSALVALVGAGALPAWFAIVIICRDFMITGFRLLAAGRGRVLGAVITGKFNTAAQMILILCAVADMGDAVVRSMMWLALVLTAVSTIENFIKEIPR